MVLGLVDVGAAETIQELAMRIRRAQVSLLLKDLLLLVELRGVDILA